MLLVVSALVKLSNFMPIRSFASRIRLPTGLNAPRDGEQEIECQIPINPKRPQTISCDVIKIFLAQ